MFEIEHDQYYFCCPIPIFLGMYECFGIVSNERDSVLRYIVYVST